MQRNILKEKAVELRKRGYSYSLITQKLGLSKSTLSNWLKDILFVPNRTVQKRIKHGPFISGQRRHNQKVQNITEIKKAAKKELGRISRRDLWMLGLGLYIGEGSKLYEQIRVINSDPATIRLALRWFRDVCELKNENFSLAIHLYPDNDINVSINYWSKELNIPKKQFRKTQIDTRENKSYKKKRKLPYGTAHLSVVSRGNPMFGCKLHRRIMGWLEGSLEQV